MDRLGSWPRSSPAGTSTSSAWSPRSFATCTSTVAGGTATTPGQKEKRNKKKRKDTGSKHRVVLWAGYWGSRSVLGAVLEACCSMACNNSRLALGACYARHLRALYAMPGTRVP
eukprot:1352383-Rhodomonas_salina.1